MKEDLIGKKYNYITVVALHPEKRVKGNHRLWVCKCDCGTKLILPAYNLKNGNTKSCGCLRRSKIGPNNACWKGYKEISSVRYTECKRNAEIRNLDFNITIKDMWRQFIKQDRQCALTGQSITHPKSHKDFEATASLDRIDSSKGYTKDNIHWVHKKINQMKWDLPINEFIFFCKCVAKHMGVDSFKNADKLG